MSQPQWRIVANLGDADPIEYGGAFVFVDETKVYDPEVEVWQEPPEDSDDSEPWRVYRWSLRKCTVTYGILSDNPFHPKHPAWFAETLPDISACCDFPDISDALCSDNIIQRASAYIAIARYHGEYNFDDPPLVLNREGIEARYEQHSKLLDQVS